jgi:hypothetical protein
LDSKEKNMNSKRLGSRVIPEVLLAEHRDDVTRAYLAAQIVSDKSAVKKLVTKLADAIFKALPEGSKKDLESKVFKKDFGDGLKEWASNNDPNKTDLGKRRYELALFVGEHNTGVLFKEVVPSLKENPWNNKLTTLVGACV